MRGGSNRRPAGGHSGLSSQEIPTAGDPNRRRFQPQEIPTGGDSNRRRFQPHRELSPPPVPQEIGRLEGQCLLLDAENANMIEDLQRLTDERLQVLAHAKNMD